MNLKKIVSVTAGVAAATGFGIYKITRGKEIKEPTTVYEITQKWLDTLDLEKLNEVHEWVQKEYMNPNRIHEKYDYLDATLRYIKKRIRALKSISKPIASGLAYHREHGHNLYKPD